MINFTYNLASGTWLTPTGTAGTDWTPDLNFGEAPELTITVQGLPLGIALATAWQVAVAKDWQSSTSPMCRTTEDITCTIEGNNATFTFIVDTATERFLKVVDGKGDGVDCSMQIVGISDGTPCCFVTLPWLCRPALDPHGSAGPLPPIPTTNMTEAEVEAIAEQAAEDIAEQAAQEAVEEALDDYYDKTATDDLLDGKANLVDGKVPASELPALDYIPTAEKGAANGVAELDGNGKVPSGQLPLASGTIDGTYGVVRIFNHTLYGITIGNSYKDLQIFPPTNADIANRRYKRPIVAENLNTAVTAALTDANHITLTAEQQQTARGVLGIDGTTDIIALTGASGTVEPGKCYSLTMTEDFTLSASSVASGIYGESVLFVTPGSYAFSVASGITLDAEMIAGLRYRLLVSWTPFGVHAEQTAEWEA